MNTFDYFEWYEYNFKKFTNNIEFKYPIIYLFIIMLINY